MAELNRFVSKNAYVNIYFQIETSSYCPKMNMLLLFLVLTSPCIQGYSVPDTDDILNE